MSDDERAEQRRAYHRAYYHRTKERRRELAANHTVDREAHLAARQRYVKKRIAIIDAAKNVPCADCGQRFPPVAMDFHHLDGSKEFGIGKRKSNSVARLQAEIAKCVVLCAVCHRLRHYG